jgi:hypothetical protein
MLGEIATRRFEMLVREAKASPVDTCGGHVAVARAATRMTHDDHGAMPVALHGNLIDIIQREILRSVGLGNNPEPTRVNQRTGAIEGATGVRSRSSVQA